MADNNLEKTLQVHLANLFVVYMKVYKYHWNIKGEGFLAIHKFFNDVFNSLSEIIDETAERMRQLNLYAPCSCVEYCSLSTIKESSGFNVSIEQSIKDIADDLDTLNNGLQVIYRVLDEGTLALFTNHDLILSKHRWFLTSMLE